MHPVKVWVERETRAVRIGGVRTCNIWMRRRYIHAGYIGVKVQDGDQNAHRDAVSIQRNLKGREAASGAHQHEDARVFEMRAASSMELLVLV